ncbi:hypothetical protein D3C80_1332740 [compost metagenome]
MGLYFKARYGVDDILCGMKGYQTSMLKALSVNAGDQVGTAAATEALRQGHKPKQLAVFGVERADQPRFGSLYRANLRILRTLGQIMMDDLRPRG